jgi:hypothetical protein
VKAEISYDLVMEEDMDFVEGTFRLPGGEWQVVIVSKGSVPSPEVKPTTWASGVSGVFVTFPDELNLDKSAVEDLLGRAFGVSQWDEVRGPDSMQLR